MLLSSGALGTCHWRRGQETTALTQTALESSPSPATSHHSSNFTTSQSNTSSSILAILTPQSQKPPLLPRAFLQRAPLRRSDTKGSRWHPVTMPKPNSSRRSNSSDNLYCNAILKPRPNIFASCYTVNASTTALKGFHYSTTGVGGECGFSSSYHTRTHLCRELTFDFCRGTVAFLSE